MRWTRYSLPLVAAATTILAPGIASAAVAKVAVVNHQLDYIGAGTSVNDLRIARHAGAFAVRDLDFEKRPVAGLHRRVLQLRGHHLAQALEARHFDS